MVSKARAMHALWHPLNDAKPSALVLVFAAALTWSLWPVLCTMAGIRWARDPRYAHGYLVPNFLSCHAASASVAGATHEVGSQRVGPCALVRGSGNPPTRRILSHRLPSKPLIHSTLHRRHHLACGRLEQLCMEHGPQSRFSHFTVPLPWRSWPMRSARRYNPSRHRLVHTFCRPSVLWHTPKGM